MLDFTKVNQSNEWTKGVKKQHIDLRHLTLVLIL